MMSEHYVVQETRRLVELYHELYPDAPWSYEEKCLMANIATGEQIRYIRSNYVTLGLAKMNFTGQLVWVWNSRPGSTCLDKG